MNLRLLQAAFTATDREALSAACAAIAADFHPSLLSELMYSELRESGDRAQMVADVADYLFLMSIGANLAVRRMQLAVDETTLAGVHRTHAMLPEVLGSTAPDDMPRVVRDLARSCAQPAAADAHRVASEYTARAIKDLRASASTLRDMEALAELVSVAVQNVLLVSLDLPPISADGLAFLRAWWDTTVPRYLPAVPSGAHTRREIPGVVTWLRSVQRLAEDHGLASVADFSSAAAQIVSGLRHRDLTEFEGDRITGMGNCINCSMNFASMVLTSIDSRCPFLYRFGPELIYWPAGLNESTCTFCGHRATVDSPTMFFAIERDQVVYLLPNRGAISEPEVVALYREIIEQTRESYMERVSRDVRRRFAQAPELITQSWPEFVYAAHMGDTVPEDHVFNLVFFEDGTGLAFDLAKRFARGLTRDEVAAYRASPNCVETGEVSFEGLLRSQANLQGDRKLTRDDFLRAQLATVNATLEEARRRGCAATGRVGSRAIVREYGGRPLQ